MSFAHWDELVRICMECDEYDEREVLVIKKIRVNREPTSAATKRREITYKVPVHMARPRKVEEAAGIH